MKGNYSRKQFTFIGEGAQNGSLTDFGPALRCSSVPIHPNSTLPHPGGGVGVGGTDSQKINMLNATTMRIGADL